MQVQLQLCMMQCLMLCDGIVFADDGDCNSTYLESTCPRRYGSTPTQTECGICAGRHQSVLRQAGCTATAVHRWCAAAGAGARQPCVPLLNAAKPGSCMPLTGLGVVGYGCAAGGPSQCWHYGTRANPGPCCTQSHCPVINATREWLRMGGARIDTGYGYGDDIGDWPPKAVMSESTGTKFAHDLVGVGIGIRQSGIARENIFVTGKVCASAERKSAYQSMQTAQAGCVDYGLRGTQAGMLGPMGPYEAKQDVQIIKELGLEYIDLLLMHDLAHQCMRAPWGKHWGPDAARKCR
eukprot:SAG11_NODE_3183_length_2625_cov_13.427680_1_plen_294_part_00